MTSAIRSTAKFGALLCASFSVLKASASPTPQNSLFGPQPSNQVPGYDPSKDPCGSATGYHTTVDVSLTTLNYGNAFPWDLLNRVSCPDAGDCTNGSFAGPTSFISATSNDWYEKQIQMNVTQGTYNNGTIGNFLQKSIEATMQNATKTVHIGPCKLFDEPGVDLGVPCPPEQRDNSTGNYDAHYFPDSITLKRWYGGTECGSMSVKATLLEDPEIKQDEEQACEAITVLTGALPALIGIFAPELAPIVALMGGVSSQESCPKS